jgi:hypothetical protein
MTTTGFQPEMSHLEMVIQGLRARAERARRISRNSLLGIVAVVSVGGIAFWFVGTQLYDLANKSTDEAKAAIETVVAARKNVGVLKDNWADTEKRLQASANQFSEAFKSNRSVQKLQDAEKARLVAANSGLKSAEQKKQELEKLTSERKRADQKAAAALNEADVMKIQHARAVITGERNLADLITASEPEVRARLEKNAARLRALTKDHQAALAEAKEIDAKISALAAVNRGAGAAEAKKLALENLDTYAEWESVIQEGHPRLIAAVGDLNDAIVEARTTDEKLSSDIDKLNATARAMPASIQTSSQSVLLLSILLTRGAIAVLVFFLAQILLGLYRYNARLEHYFTGRADALRLNGSNLTGRAARDGLVQMMNELSGQGIDFGKSPASPTKDAVDLAHTLLKVRNGSSAAADD